MGPRHFIQMHLEIPIKQDFWRDYCVNEIFQKLLTVYKSWKQAKFNRRAETVKHQGFSLTQRVLKFHIIVLPYK